MKAATLYNALAALKLVTDHGIKKPGEIPGPIWDAAMIANHELARELREEQARQGWSAPVDFSSCAGDTSSAS